MPIYTYKAVDQSGKPAQGQMDALNEVDLELRLKRMGIDLITSRLASQRQKMFGGAKAKLEDLVMFAFQMEQLSRAGVPLLEGLAELRDSTPNPAFREVLSGLVSGVEGGQMLSQAMEEHPKVFSNVFLSLVKAGEQTGQLTEVFDNLANTLKWQGELVAKTKKLLAYPLFVLTVVLGATTFLMTFLVPQMAVFIKNLGQELPLQTRFIIAVSDALVNYWWAFILVPAVIITAIIITLKKSAAARYKFDYIKLNVPITGDILKKIIMARFARYFALMYQTGIPILDAIKTCEGIVDNEVVADSLSRAHQQISGGERMSEAFHGTGMFPPMVVRMIKMGESTGALDKSLLNIAYLYNRDVNDSIDKMLALIEPALTVVLGGILGLIMFAVLGPVYDSFSKMQF
ncbi:MAG: type II secretion system F family protein [Methylophilales bacterium]|nr:type II secretion system F family protein [Methylophilales bacterium]